MDIAIVGNGPAGWSCAMTARMRGLSTVVIAPTGAGGWLSGAERIDNYPGLPQVSGKELLERFRQQALALGAEEKSALVRQIMPNGERFLLLAENDVLEAKAVVLCMGAARPVLLPGEEELLGSGVSYCATCDGFLYKGKTIAVLCTSERFEREIEYLADLAKKVYLIPLYKNVAVRKENIEKIVRMPTGIAGGLRAQKLLFKEEELPVDGIFMLKESVSPAVLVGGLEMENGHVKVNRDMSTNLKGCFAAGDCTGRPYQYAKAAGEGNVAAHAVCERKE